MTRIQHIIVIENTPIIQDVPTNEIKGAIEREFSGEEGKTVVGNMDRSKAVIAMEISDNIYKVMNKIQSRKRNPIGFTKQIEKIVLEDFEGF